MSRSLVRLFGSGALIACTLAILAFPTSQAAPPGEPGGGIAAPPAPAVDNDRAEFGAKTFPEGEARWVEFNPDGQSWFRTPERERRDQMRDWVLVATAGSLGLSADELSRALADVPVSRRDYLRGTAQPEFGVTRTCDIGKGRAVAVIPAGDDDEKRDHLAHVADEYRKNRGTAPDSVVVFTYELDMKGIRASVTRQADIAGKDLFTADYGYYESTVAALDDLQAFVSKVRDLTYAAKPAQGKGLILGGRALLSRKYRALRVEDIAAIWQAQSALPRGRDSIGFSLDPTYDFDALTAWFAKEVKPALLKIAEEKGAPIDKDDIADAEDALKLKLAAVLEALLGTVRDAGKEKRNAEWIRLVATWEQGLQNRQFQRARYDGDLQGTEVGMFLFYTDLLAKLWCATDFAHSAPFNDIDGFRARPMGGNPASFLQKTLANPATRIWFGVEHAGYQLLANKAGGEKVGIAFARRAARLYSASSDPLKPGAEVPTNPASDAAFGWWNDHYEEVARYEPEYERLNEFMKWSLVVAWLADARQLDKLDCLKEVEVDHKAWFPKWARGNTDLRFVQWDKIGFHPKGYKATTTEAMPILRSVPYRDYAEPYANRHISGGVGGASPSHDIAPRSTAPVTPVPEPIGRGWVPGARPTTFRDVEYDFNGSGTVKIKPKAGAELVGRSAEVRPAELKATVTTQPDGLSRSVDLGGKPQDRTDFRVTRDAVVVNQYPGAATATNTAQQIATSWTQSQPAWYTLTSAPELRSACGLPDGSLLVRVKGSDNYLKLTPEKQPAADGKLPAGADARVSGTLPGSKTLLLSEVKPEDVGALFADAEYVSIKLPSYSGARPVLDAGASGPPKPPRNGLKITFSDDKESILGTVDRTGSELVVAVKDLPEAYQKNPTLLLDRIRFAETADARDAVKVALAMKKTEASAKLYPLATEKADPAPEAASALDGGRPTDALRAIEAVPEADLTPAQRLLKVTAALRLGRVESAATYAGLKPGTKADPTSLKPLLEEVAARALDPKTSSAEVEVVLKLVTQGALDTSVTSVEGKLVLTGYARVEAKDKPKPDDVKTDSTVYVEHGTGVADADWTAAIKDGKLDDVLTAKKAELVVIYGSTLPKLQPERVSYMNPKTFDSTFAKRLGKGSAAAATAALAAALAKALANGDEDGDDDCDPDPDFPAVKKERKPCPTVYLIRAKK